MLQNCSLLSVCFTTDDVGVGTIVGSAVFNILIIIGLSAVFAKEVLNLDCRPLLRDAVFYGNAYEKDSSSKSFLDIEELAFIV